MQLAEVEVLRLFGRYNHRIRFPHSDREVGGPSVVILHGPNGIGKTRMLRMIDGTLRLDFDAFRDIPFQQFRIAFNDSSSVTVSRGEVTAPLSIQYQRDPDHAHSVLLHPFHSGPNKLADADAVDAFRRAFLKSTRSISFQFIDALRHPKKPERPPLPHVPTFEEWMPAGAESDPMMREYFLHAYSHRVASQTQERQKPLPLAERVLRFITDAQVSHQRFFASSEPDIFKRILRNVEDSSSGFVPGALTARLESLREREKQQVRYGLEKVRWDYVFLTKWLSDWESRSERTPQALAALAAYIDILEARAAERESVVTRLQSFEHLTRSFFIDKEVRVTRGAGFVIIPRGSKVGSDESDERPTREVLNETREALNESQLSSGEHQLLTLLVTALVTQRRGAVIAIDEPELSMHISWQTRLIGALLDCASGAQPQFIFTTHSPDIAAAYPDALVELRAEDGRE